MSRKIPLAAAMVSIAVCAAPAAQRAAAAPQMPGMNMPMPAGAAASAPATQAYTDNHRFLIKLRAVPRPIPFEKYFTLQFSVYDAGRPTNALFDAHVRVTAGMRHGSRQGFTHGMQSAPRIVAEHGVFIVSGMYFHMTGPWTLKVDVTRNGDAGTAYFTLPCCGQ